MKKLKKQLKIAEKKWLKAHKKSVKLADRVEKLQRKIHGKLWRSLKVPKRKNMKEGLTPETETTAPATNGEVQNQTEGTMPAMKKVAPKRAAKKATKKVAKKVSKKATKKVAKKATKKVAKKAK